MHHVNQDGRKVGKIQENERRSGPGGSILTAEHFVLKMTLVLLMGKKNTSVLDSKGNLLGFLENHDNYP